MSVRNLVNLKILPCIFQSTLVSSCAVTPMLNCKSGRNLRPRIPTSTRKTIREQLQVTPCTVNEKRVRL
ncbi:hypothetical protein G7K_2311-t1 [Saitoella complicata NRRL Y-17804]|uniref:Transposase Tc1-like domain-containing protein n=1 Tax=Saitoella complicata (strain BCRC 22490 / CBS 7301 / JCM 7358 / NBRC 10748 / NRRL Y-17804) TaxID=698492 RepID=A0A0E9NE48_SAICN|nr:hypothetical protein G7K_2311-t1 [Saitoella complicata NRRL Y-17804]